MKHILKLFTLLGIIAATNSCRKNDFIPVAKNVYIAGAVSNGTHNVATYWKNGVATQVTDGTKGSFAYAIAVSGNDVYVGGIEDDDPSGHGTLKYWKNGIPTTLSMGSSLAEFGGMTVVGNDVYVVGSEAENNGRVIKYWKNGVETRLTDGKYYAHAYGIAVSGNDVYVVGNDGTPGAKFWKNTTAVHLPGFYGSQLSIAVDGNDVYVGGLQLIGNKKVAMYWKNGQVIRLSDGTRDANIRAIAVDNGVVHATGSEADPVNVPIPRYSVGKYWNSKGASVNLSSATDWHWGNPYDIAVYGNDVFIAGYEVDGINGYNYIITKLWKNGVETDIGSKTSGVASSGRGIFVTE